MNSLLRLKNIICNLLFCMFFGFVANAQQNWNVSLQTYKGTILAHSNNIQHLITSKPSGYLFSVNHRVNGTQSWHHTYRFPEIGFSFHTQNNHNQTLGNLYGLYAHYNFYFLNRNLQFRVGQGVAYATHPYDKETNFRNVAYGSKFMPSTYFMFSYNKPRIWQNIGLNAGLLFVHHSNATIKSPNTSTNTLGLNLGLTYHFSNSDMVLKSGAYNEIPMKMRYNFLVRTGVNESHIVGIGQKPFYHLGVIAEKPLNNFGAAQLGVDVFLSNSLKELIPFLATSFPEENMKKDTDWKRVGVFVGYEWYLNKLTAEGNVGYYVHDEYKKNGSLYQRLGLRYYITPAIYGSMALKTHFAKAEAFEVGVGYKL
ncbi:acyloxyacyl hydrolase [Myroides sp. JBRI-B21084]|uniref:acyloxyacyl hydrolase n=1 Tax=Myroides sp. JBRI-B21084 TaxID=3119977 RepID=UPI0026E36012|nr:acyloxyacyl hydrolase [Paenimyroides cloacae]WKW47446.1 acyloxyacyl hydrolase [Paenimyroides cloacae]